MTLTTQIFDDEKKLQLMKDTICKGSSDDEFQLFTYTCKRLGLDPFARQIYPVKRWDSNLKKEVMTIQTGIDGYRLIADRTGRYSPGRESTYVHDKNGRLISATAYVMKQTPDGHWHECAYTAHYSEYVSLKKDGTPTNMWASKPYLMLSKCAESGCLRRAFPAELSGVYTKEEMTQADSEIIYEKPAEGVDKEAEKKKFIDKWKVVYDEKTLIDYLDKRSKHFKISIEETIGILAVDETNFIKEIDSWIKNNTASTV